MKKVILAMADYIAKAIKYLVTAVLLGMALLMFVEVLRRYIWQRQFVWSEELIRYMAVWVAFLGGAVAYKEKTLVSFDLFSGKLKGLVKLIVTLVCNTITVAFLAFIFYLGVKNVTSPSIVRQISIGLQCSMVFPYMAIPVGTGLSVIFGINNYFVIIDDFIRSKGEIEC